MGMRPPSGSSGSTAGSIEFGIAALDGDIQEADISFPTRAGELQETHGDIEIPVDPSGNTMTLREALAECGQEQFEHKQELLNALHPVFETR